MVLRIATFLQGNSFVEEMDDETGLLNEMTRLNPMEILIADSHAKDLLRITEKHVLKIHL